MFEGGVHEADPGVAGGLIDGEGDVAGAEFGVAAGLDVVGRTSEAEDEEVAEAEAGGFEVGVLVGLFVHGAEDGVGGDLAVEGGGEAVEAFGADLGIDGLVVHGSGFGVRVSGFGFEISGGRV